MKQAKMENSQQVSVQFFSAQPEVRLALQNSMPMLSQMLDQTGIQLGQSDVRSQNFGSNQQQQKDNFKAKFCEAFAIRSYPFKGLVHVQHRVDLCHALHGLRHDFKRKKSTTQN